MSGSGQRNGSVPVPSAGRISGEKSGKPRKNAVARADVSYYNGRWNHVVYPAGARGFRLRKGAYKMKLEKMKLENIKDVNKFFQVVDSCKGKVMLVTGEGDQLNLKSKLSQYVSLANIFSNGSIPEMELIASEPEDVQKLVNFMMNQ